MFFCAFSPFLPKDFRGSEERKILDFFGGVPCCFPKKRQGKEDQGFLPFSTLLAANFLPPTFGPQNHYSYSVFLHRARPLSLRYLLATFFAGSERFRSSFVCQDVGKGGLSLRGVAFMTVCGTGDSQRDSRESIRANRVAIETPIFIALQGC